MPLSPGPHRTPALPRPAPHPLWVTGRRLTALPLAALFVLAAACSGGSEMRSNEELVDYVETEQSTTDQAAPAAAPPPTVGARGQGQGGGVARGLDQGTPPAEPPAQPGAAQPASMIIRTGEALVEVDSMEQGVAQVQALARRLGGYVASTSVQAGDHAVKQARLELKIPSARFDEAMSGLRPFGELRSSSVRSEDVGEEFVDVTARVSNARRLEERLLGLLATRTGRLEDVLAVERELARVREEIERYEGRLRYLRTRVAMSTLTVTVAEPAPVVGDYPGSNPIAEAFGDAWRNFVGFVAAFISSLGVLIPLGLLGIGFIWLARWLWRRFRSDDGPRARLFPPKTGKDAAATPPPPPDPVP